MPRALVCFAAMADPQAQRLDAWLLERGIEGDRRIVRASAEGVLVSKFEPGFAARLHDAVASVPKLFDLTAVTERFAATPAATPRVEGWRLAVEALLADLAATRDLTREQLSEIQAGVDSVAGLLDSALWSAPVVGSEWAPSPSEREAYADALERMDDDSSIFTRFYGEFEGTPVYNHCPGAQHARRLLDQAWAVVTGPTLP